MVNELDALIRQLEILERANPQSLKAVRSVINKGNRRDCPTLRKVAGDGEIEIVPNKENNGYNITCPYFDRYYGVASQCGVLGNKRSGCPYAETLKP